VSGDSELLWVSAVTLSALLSDGLIYCPYHHCHITATGMAGGLEAGRAPALGLDPLQLLNNRPHLHCLPGPGLALMGREHGQSPGMLQPGGGDPLVP
jgi:hypothetical protein